MPALIPGLEISIAPAAGLEWALAAGAIERFHYLHTFPDPRGMPVVHSVRLQGEWVGCLVWCRPESNRRYKGVLTYGSQDDVAAGRARFDRWEILNLARVWFVPDVQAGGRLCQGDLIPGFTDRRGQFRSTFASAVVRLGIAAIRYDYLMVYPPCFPEQPYQIRCVLSYCDTRVHRGVLYRAAGFAPAGANQRCIETWYYDKVDPLEPYLDADVRYASRRSSRSIRKRHARGAIDLQRIFGFPD